MRTFRPVALLATCALLALAATESSAASPSGPSNCTPKGIRTALVSFVEALNRGDYEALDAVFAEKPDFQWYATNGRIGPGSKRRDNLISYFRARHRRGERLGLIRFQFNGNSRHWGNFEITMRRSVRGIQAGRWRRARGKGAAVCNAGSTRLIVMSYSTVGS